MRTLVPAVCLMLTLFPLQGQEGAARPVVSLGVPVRGLAWDSTDAIFAYMQEDSVLLHSSEAPYRYFGIVELPGILDYFLYHESDSGVQLIAGAADGIIAVWDIPLDNTPPPNI